MRTALSSYEDNDLALTAFLAFAYSNQNLINNILSKINISEAIPAILRMVFIAGNWESFWMDNIHEDNKAGNMLPP